jgi:hypothetical protein
LTGAPGFDNSNGMDYGSEIPVLSSHLRFGLRSMKGI